MTVDSGLLFGPPCIDSHERQNVASESVEIILVIDLF